MFKDKRKLNILKKVIVSVILTIFVSCNEDEPYNPPTDPKQAILGRWELIEIGNWPNMFPSEPTYYIDYLPDSIIGIYDYKTKEYYISSRKYWIDSLFHEKTIREDGYEIIINYSYEFYTDKMRMDMLDVLPIFETSIYRRKK